MIVNNCLTNAENATVFTSFNDSPEMAECGSKRRHVTLDELDELQSRSPKGTKHLELRDIQSEVIFTECVLVNVFYHCFVAIFILLEHNKRVN